jgi:hypothetical protein
LDLCPLVSLAFISFSDSFCLAWLSSSCKERMKLLLFLVCFDERALFFVVDTRILLVIVRTDCATLCEGPNEVVRSDMLYCFVPA